MGALGQRRKGLLVPTLVQIDHHSETAKQSLYVCTITCTYACTHNKHTSVVSRIKSSRHHVMLIVAVRAGAPDRSKPPIGALVCSLFFSIRLIAILDSASDSSILVRPGWRCPRSLGPSGTLLSRDRAAWSRFRVRALWEAFDWSV